MHEILREGISGRNLQGLPTTSKNLVKKIQDVTGETVSTRTVIRHLHDMNCSYIVGNVRDARADNEGNKSFRHQYVQRKISNLD